MSTRIRRSIQALILDILLLAWSTFDGLPGNNPSEVDTRRPNLILCQFLVESPRVVYSGHR